MGRVARLTLALVIVGAASNCQPPIAGTDGGTGGGSVTGGGTGGGSVTGGGTGGGTGGMGGTGGDGGTGGSGGGAALDGHSASNHVVGGVSAQSPNYKVIMTTGSTPGGTSASGGTKTNRGGLTGSTQGQ